MNVESILIDLCFNAITDEVYEYSYTFLTITVYLT